jgi:hypothetical protein
MNIYVMKKVVIMRNNNKRSLVSTDRECEHFKVV